MKQVDAGTLRKTLAQMILAKQQELIEYFNANQQKLELTKAQQIKLQIGLDDKALVGVYGAEDCDSMQMIFDNWKDSRKF